MWSFQYKHGDRPLEGYTIQRAAGRGGFGEVYYALSDSGREVALKVVQGYEQIELRGISQCMNLKSPHLVTIFDVKYNAEGKPFVLMEFVSGPNLRQMLDECPAGLGTQKAAFFLREIGKGLTFLHECGIVHRDLKPANIFFENGYVKIGDYGLSKAISPTQHSGQTVTVGTVHYMAPEVGAGKYDRSIDIYALGAVLYELLTGTVPFIGASPSEILMKHLQAEPDLSGVPEPFRTVIKKAMAKDPAQRYQSVQEMVEAVFGAEHVRMSVSHFSPDDLSMVAGRVAQKIALGGGEIGGAGGSSSVVGGQNFVAAAPDRLGFAGPVNRIGPDIPHPPMDRRADWNAGFAPALQLDESESLVTDPMPHGMRILLGALTAGIIAVAAGVVSSGNHDLGPLSVPLFVFAAICGATSGLMLAWRHVAFQRLARESHSVRRLAVAGIVSVTMFLIAGVFWLPMHGYDNTTWIAMLAPLVFMDTWRWTRATRKDRVTFGPAIGAAIFALILAGMFHGYSVIAMAVVAGVALVVQVIAPWDPDPVSRKSRTVLQDNQQNGYGNPAGAAATDNPRIDSPALGIPGARGAIPAPPVSRAYSFAPDGTRPVPRFMPFVWLGLFVVLITIALMLLIAVATNSVRGNDQPFVVAWGLGLLAASMVTMVGVFKRRYVNWWTYLARPIIMTMCLTSALGSLMILSSAHLRSDEAMAAAFFMVFPGIVMLVLPFLPTHLLPGIAPTQIGGVSPHTRGMALGLSALMWCGVGGIHRFYVGKIGTGILWMLTGGLFGIGQVVDLIMILNGTFTDAQGRLLKRWDLNDPIRPTPPPLPASHAAPNPGTRPDLFAPAAYAPIVMDPAPARAASWDQPTRPAKSRRDARRETVATGGILSVLAALLVLVTMLVSLAIGLQLPHAVAVNLPDADIARDLRSLLFADYPNWGSLVLQLLWPVGIFMAMLAIGASMMARRKTSFAHILRAVVGIAGLLAAVAVLTADFNGASVWSNVAMHLNAHQSGLAMEAFLRPFRAPGPPISAAICLASLLMLSIPYRRPSFGDRGMN